MRVRFPELFVADYAQYKHAPNLNTTDFGVSVGQSKCRIQTRNPFTFQCPVFRVY